MEKLNVAVLGNLRRNAPRRSGEPADAWADLDSDETMTAIVEALEGAGHVAYFMEGDLSLVQRLSRSRPDICFNMAEGYEGDARESHIPALLEMMNIPYTGSRVLTHALTLNKARTKQVLRASGIPTPAFQVFGSATEPLDPALQFPLFVKPNREGSGMGVSAQSIVRDEGELRDQVAYIVRAYKQEALVEHYIEGRELTCALVGNEDLHAFPIMEIDMSTTPASELGVYTHMIKQDMPEAPTYRCPAPLDEGITDTIKQLAVSAFRAVEALDVARVDMRLGASDGHPYVLEINTLPGLDPNISDLTLAARADGVGYRELVNMILQEAVWRYDRAGRPVRFREVYGAPRYPEPIRW